jgi:hypothetical protein
MIREKNSEAMLKAIQFPVPNAQSDRRQRALTFHARKGAAVGMALIALAWAAAVAAIIPVGLALRGDFKFDRPEQPAKGEITRVGADSMPSLRLDSATALVLIYSSKCSQCKANTDNWLRLAAEMRARRNDVPVYVVSTPADSTGRPDLPASLRAAFHEYRLSVGDVPTDFRSRFIPATVVLRRGRVDLIAYGVIGPRRRSRIVAAFDGAVR